jgi:hypothetical protein
MTTKILFEKAHLIINIIRGRMMAKEASLRNRLSGALRDPVVTQKFHTRPAYTSNGGNHLSMGRVLDFQQVGPY